MVSPDHVRNAEKWLLAAEGVLEDEPGLDLSTVKRAHASAGGNQREKSTLEEAFVIAAGLLVASFLAERAGAGGDDCSDIIAAAASALTEPAPLGERMKIARELKMVEDINREPMASLYRVLHKTGDEQLASFGQLVRVVVPDVYGRERDQFRAAWMTVFGRYLDAEVTDAR